MKKGSTERPSGGAPGIVKDIDRMIDVVGRGWELLSAGRRAEKVRAVISDQVAKKSDADLVMDVLLTRKRSKGKFTNWERLYFTSSGLRWATPEVAAVHCARRMKCERIVDLACGQGGQIIAFSSRCSEVVAIDKDPLNLFIAKLNCIAVGADNVDLICGDSLSKAVSDRVGDVDHAFCDPARPPGSEERSLSELLPDPRDILKVYSDRVKGLCLEVPPYLSLDKVPFPCEAEYVSIDGRINRLNLYTGDLARSTSSAVVLPGGESISGEAREMGPGRVDPVEIGRYLHELDPAVVKAGLVWKAVGGKSSPDLIQLDRRRTMLSTEKDVVSPFFRGTYQYLGSAEDISTMIEMLNERGVGSVTLRWKITPSDYWPVRNSIESKLSGKGKVQIFRYEERYLIAEKIRPIHVKDGK